MNKVKPGSNMYQGFVTHTWSPLRGCPYQCTYCYVKNFGGQPETVTLNEKILNEDLGRGNKIFVCHMTDMFADGVSTEIIQKVIYQCKQFPGNDYIFQSKNPARYNYKDYFANLSATLGTTIETDNTDLIKSYAPHPFDRVQAMRQIKEYPNVETFVTIEPIMQFTTDFWRWIVDARPDFVNIGADSKHHNLPEPTYAEVLELIDRIKGAGIEVRVKSNLKRLEAK